LRYFVFAAWDSSGIVYPCHGQKPHLLQRRFDCEDRFLFKAVSQLRSSQSSLR